MSEAKRKVISVIVGTLSGIAVSLLCVLIFSFIVVKSESVNYAILAPFGIAAACVGAFFGGLICAKMSGSMGMLIGSVNGLVMFLLFLLVSTIMGELPELVSLLRLALMMLSGAIGGVVGVNRKRKRRRRN